jgi:hypothetical protein
MLAFTELMVAVAATLATHDLALHRKWGGVRASSGITLAFIAGSSLVPGPHATTLQAICLGASFVGMSEPHRLSYRQLAVASVGFVGLFHLLVPRLTELGGVLGLAAFIACVGVHVVARVAGRAK